ncbi:LRR receptor-like serine/threonine-protein kinase GSO1 [Spinacia oleracea]|uniref:LRR receptor-like serine/threonine-protein kinase GSO1 n=1 Tax=Spinacia oleracea TaxID=3562 RepID=A0ABM3QZ33_SPIOL|nr:LRR receptor-like serine/threonine-protein kinase GSO1 [Spinacia oleracea]
MIGIDVRTLFMSNSVLLLEKTFGAREITLLNPVWIHSKRNGAKLWYQVIAGVTEQRILDPLLHDRKLLLSAVCFAVRTGNTLLGSLIFAFMSKTMSKYLSLNWFTRNGQSLRYNDLSMNKLTGIIPEGYGQMNQLEDLVLSGNIFSGFLPTSICSNTTILQSLYLSNCQFSGEIPLEIGKFLSLERLDLSNNTLNGSIPVELYGLLNLTDLYLYNNSL